VPGRRFEQRLEAALRVLAGLGSLVADGGEGIAGAMPASRSMMSAEAVMRVLPRGTASRERAVRAVELGGGIRPDAKPRQGATSSARSWSDRRVSSWVAAIECTWNETSLAAAASVGRQRGDDLVDRADVGVGDPDELVERDPVGVDAEERAGEVAQAVSGEFERARAVLGVDDERRPRREHAHRRALGQGRTVRLDDRQLQLVQRRRGFRRTGLGAREQQTVAALAARRPPSTENVACQMRDDRSPAADRCASRSADAATLERVEEHLEVLGEDLAATVGLAPERRERRRRAAGREPQLHASAAQLVEHGGILRDAEGIVERERDDARRERDAARALRRGGEQHERRRQSALVLAEVVLREPRRGEAAGARPGRSARSRTGSGRRRRPLRGRLKKPRRGPLMRIPLPCGGRTGRRCRSPKRRPGIAASSSRV
jgi:hypothetical protein